MPSPHIAVYPDKGIPVVIDLDFLSDIAKVNHWQEWNKQWELSEQMYQPLRQAMSGVTIAHTVDLVKVAEQLRCREHERHYTAAWEHHGRLLLWRLRQDVGFSEAEPFWRFALECLFGRCSNLAYMIQRDLAKVRYSKSVGWGERFFPDLKLPHEGVGGLIISWQHPCFGRDHNYDELGKLGVTEPDNRRDDSIE